jgi:hypothetical protein
MRAELDQAVRTKLLLGARDVFVNELLAIVRREGIAKALLQTGGKALKWPPH